MLCTDCLRILHAHSEQFAGHGGELFKHCDGINALRISANLGCRLCLILFDQIPDAAILDQDVAPTYMTFQNPVNFFVGCTIFDLQRNAGCYVLNFIVPVGRVIKSSTVYFVRDTGK